MLRKKRSKEEEKQKEDEDHKIMTKKELKDLKRLKSGK
jgi:hypothetical protein